MASQAFLRFHEDEMTFRLRGAVLGDDFDAFGLSTDQLLCKLLRIGDGRRKEYELRCASIKSTDPLEAPEYLGNVAPKHTAIGMHLIDDHKAKLFPEAFPLVVVS